MKVAQDMAGWRSWPCCGDSLWVVAGRVGPSRILEVWGAQEGVKRLGQGTGCDTKARSGDLGRVPAGDD